MVSCVCQEKIEADKQLIRNRAPKAIDFKYLVCISVQDCKFLHVQDLFNIFLALPIGKATGEQSFTESEHTHVEFTICVGIKFIFATLIQVMIYIL